MKTTKELIIADITAKVEAKLASHKVDLNMLNNYKAVVQNAIKDFAKAETEFKKLKSNAQNVIGLFDYAGTTLVNSSTIYFKMLDKAKELGITLDAETTKTHKDLSSNYAKKVDEAIKILNVLK